MVTSPKIIFDYYVQGIELLPVAPFLAELKKQLSSKVGICVGLVGDLGAGKTTFVRACASALGIDPAHVTSPTYTLQQTYSVAEKFKESGISRLEHWDVYRLGAIPVELTERVPSGVVQLVEWADKFNHRVDLELHLELRDDSSAASSRRVYLVQP